MSKIILKKAVIKCDVEKAFDLFIRNERLVQWLCDKADVQPEVGGKYELAWANEDCGSDNGTFGCTITVFEKNKVLAFDWKGAKVHENTMNTADPLTHVVVSFHPANRCGKKQTEVILVHSGWKNDPEWDKAREWFEKAWDYAFGALAKAAEM